MTDAPSSSTYHAADHAPAQSFTTLWNRAALAAARIHNLPLYHVSSQYMDEWKLHPDEALEKVEVAEDDCECEYNATPNTCMCGYLSIVYCHVSIDLAPDFKHLNQPWEVV